MKSDKPDTTWMVAVKKLEQKGATLETVAQNDNEISTYQYDPSKTTYSNKPAGELFYFDPNTLSKGGWEKLGLREKTIKTIENYLSKGGHFKKPEDMQRIYGLRKNEYERLAPFIKILSELNGKTDERAADKNSSTPNYVPAKPSFHSLLVDINSGDTSAFIALPGIGSKLAARIVNFRSRLGGFYSIEQVRETFGLPDSIFQKIKENLLLKNNSVKKININTATTDELKSHPYIKWNIANTITAYRNEHGVFSTIEDIKKIMTITDDIYNKIAPYLTIE
ncbi:MAG: helix-hairpin-helix domain-containing protein [Chitinophagaceae bacterium]